MCTNTKSDERRTFSYDEKLELLYKTDFRCAHCGKKLGMITDCTVEHIIPLAKGGTNESKNLVPLCMDCNREKADSIYPPTWYEYVLEKYDEELSNVIEDYINETGIIGNNCFIAFDLMDSYCMDSTGTCKDTYYKRADYSDLDEIYRLYKRYFREFAIRKKDSEIKEFVSLIFSYGAFYMNCDKSGGRERVDFILPIVPVGTREKAMDVEILYPYTRNSSVSSRTSIITVLLHLETAICETIGSPWYMLKIILPKMDRLGTVLGAMSYCPPVRYNNHSIERVYSVSMNMDMHLRKECGLDKDGYYDSLSSKEVRNHLAVQYKYASKFSEYMEESGMRWLYRTDIIGAGFINTLTFVDVHNGVASLGDIETKAYNDSLNVHIRDKVIHGIYENPDTSDWVYNGLIPVVWAFTCNMMMDTLIKMEELLEEE